MNNVTQLQKLHRQELNAQQGLEELLQLRQDFEHNRSVADAWGMTAIMSRAVLIPLNVVVNACELKKAKNAYEALVQATLRVVVWHDLAEGSKSNMALEAVKMAAEHELKAKGMAEWVPGLNIVVGLAQDTSSLLEDAETVSSGREGLDGLGYQLDRQIRQAQILLQRIREEELDLATKDSGVTFN